MSDSKSLADRIRELHEKATKGTWKGFPTGILSGATWVVANVDRPFDNEGDREFIVSMHTLVPEILAALEGDRAMVDALRKVADAADEMLSSIRSGHLASIGSIHNTYEPQIGVDAVERWSAVLAAARKSGAIE